jgi:hypothetical protein
MDLLQPCCLVRVRAELAIVKELSFCFLAFLLFISAYRRRRCVPQLAGCRGMVSIGLIRSGIRNAEEK